MREQKAPASKNIPEKQKDSSLHATLREDSLTSYSAAASFLLSPGYVLGTLGNAGVPPSAGSPAVPRAWAEPSSPKHCSVHLVQGFLQQQLFSCLLTANNRNIWRLLHFKEFLSIYPECNFFRIFSVTPFGITLCKCLQKQLLMMHSLSSFVLAKQDYFQPNHHDLKYEH